MLIFLFGKFLVPNRHSIEGVNRFGLCLLCPVHPSDCALDPDLDPAIYQYVLKILGILTKDTLEIIHDLFYFSPIVQILV